VDVFDLLPRSEIIDHVIDEIEELADQILDRDFFLFTEIQKLAVEPVADRAATCSPG
jgi:hypothetical protein